MPPNMPNAKGALSPEIQYLTQYSKQSVNKGYVNEDALHLYKELEKKLKEIEPHASETCR